MTSLIDDRRGDSIWTNLPTDVPGSAAAHTVGGSFHWLSAAHYFRLLPSQIKGTDDFCQPSDAVWQMSQHLLSPWFIGLEWPQPRGRTHQKTRQALGEKGEVLNANSSNTTFIPSLLGLHILLMVIVWPSVVFSASLTTPLSERGVGAKRCHLPFAPLIRRHCFSSVRSGSGSFVAKGNFYMKSTCF